MTDDRLAKMRALIKEQAQQCDIQAEQDEREHREHVRQHSHHALIATLNLWLDRRNMHEMPEAFVIDIDPILVDKGTSCWPQHNRIAATIGFESDSKVTTMSRVATLTARGDWEQEGLISGLAVLLLKLLEAQDA